MFPGISFLLLAVLKQQRKQLKIVCGSQYLDMLFTRIAGHNFSGVQIAPEEKRQV